MWYTDSDWYHWTYHSNLPGRSVLWGQLRIPRLSGGRIRASVVYQGWRIRPRTFWVSALAGTGFNSNSTEGFLEQPIRTLAIGNGVQQPQQASHCCTPESLLSCIFLRTPTSHCIGTKTSKTWSERLSHGSALESNSTNRNEGDDRARMDHCNQQN